MPETEQYVVVTDISGTIGGSVTKGEFDFKAAATATDKLDGKIVETAELTTREARAIDNSPGMVAALTMPTRLIAPVIQDQNGAWAPAATADEVASGDAAAVQVPWGLAATGADRSAFDGSGTTVAILDTGIDRNHPAFAGMTNIVEVDFTGTGGAQAVDDNGHGTHCAGTVFGRDCYGYRIGIARGIERAFIAKVLDGAGSGGSAELFDGLYWAISRHADVISMSLGFDFPGMVSRLAGQGLPIDLATSKALVAFRQNLRAFDALMAFAKAQAAMGAGPIVVAATGNESKAEIAPQYRIDASLPAAALEVMGIGAVGQDGARYRVAEFSNGSLVITAPGVGIVSAKSGGGLAMMSGTSMACPHAAGVAALWWQSLRQSPAYATAFSVASKLSATARSNIFNGFTRAEFGDGMVTAP